MTDTRYSDAWEAVRDASSPGVYKRRIDESLPLYATVTNPGQLPGLVLSLDAGSDLDLGELRGTDAIEAETATSSGTTEIRLRTRDIGATDVFLLVAGDLTSRILDAPDPGTAGRVLLRRFGAWQRYLRRTSVGLMSERRRLGLYGELVTLRELLLPTVGPAEAVAAWTGPDDAPQDFQLPGFAIEVKTIAHGEPQILAIEGERQLDDHGLDVLAIAHHRVLRQRGTGETLPAIIDSVRAALIAAGSDTGALDDKLLAYGYRDTDAHAYSDTGHTVRDTSHYRVRPGFPRLAENDLPLGVGRLRYSVPAVAFEPHTVPADDLRSWLAEPPEHVADDLTSESRDVEYKETVWTPVGPTQNDQHAAQVGRAIQTAVVKTVVAFMNSDGGELVIGVRDADLSVAGIEVDLVARGREPDDVDSYERDLMTLLNNQIDSLVHRQVRISFKSHETGTACHVRVAPSPNPRFGTPLPKPNEQPRPHFWVRVGNATEAREGHDLVTYIAQQWH
jgi:hypothetical protein